MTDFLVTGGAGFIGSHLVDTLVQHGAHVRVLDNFSTGKRANLVQSAAVDVVEGDVCDAVLVDKMTAGVDFVIHQAALVSVPQSMSDPAGTHAINVTGTLNILLAARQHGVKRVVLASSCAVYGDSDELPLKESAATRPMSPYAASKLIGEIYCQTFQRAHGVPTVCLRYFNVYGPRQNPDGDYAAVIPKFTERMLHGQPPIIYGDGLQTRDFVHVSDVVRANVLACEQTAAIGQVLNVAGGCDVSLLELVTTLNELGNTAFTPQFERARPGDVLHSQGDITKSAALLRFRPMVSLRDGLKHMLNDFVY